MRFLLVVPQDFQGEPVPGMLHKYGVCDISSDPKETVFLCDCNEYDALILSASLEFEDCESLCREIRGQNDNLPIVRLSTKPNYEEKIKLLNSGVDIYISSAVGAEEFYAELSVFLRRNNRSKIQDPITFKGFSFSILNRTLFYGKEPVFLRRKEYELLEYLFINIGKVLSKETLLEHIWEDGLDVESNTLEVHIRNIRNKLKQYTSEEIIRTIKGFGYIIPA
ncbi:MAG: DNA-binding response regulator [Patescibacteria group bacterium]|nr:MAG: DNA-binding response regulator [Patescibacteria group bacterium]